MRERKAAVLVGVMVCVMLLSIEGVRAGLLDLFSSDGDRDTLPPLPPVPADYAGKHMPQSWWTDPKVLADGEKVYTGLVHREVNCSNCHGKNGQPKKKGARDFRNTNIVHRFSDSFWFWRVSEGVPKTKMKAWKKFLTEEQIWAVIAYEHTFSHNGQAVADIQTEVQPVAASGK